MADKFPGRRRAPPMRMALLLLIALLVVALVAAGIAVVGGRLLAPSPALPLGGAAVIAFASTSVNRATSTPCGPTAPTCAS